MEASTEVTSPAEFSPAVREVVLKVLEECADSLAVYQNILRQQSATRDDTANIFPNVEISEMSILQTFTGGAAGMTDSRREAAHEKLRRDSLYVSDIIRDLKREIDEHGTIDVLIKEIEKIVLREEQDQLLIEENERMRTIVAELRKAISDRKAANEREKERVTKKLTLTRLIENRIEQWRQRYDREKKMYEEGIRKVRNEIEDARKYLEELTTEYRNNQEFIDTYLAEQEALRRQKEHEDHVQRSTIKMQAWWRGVMVRRKLGPYRSEEKKKKKPIKTKK